MNGRTFTAWFFQPGRVRTAAMVSVGIGLLFSAGIHHRRSVAFCYSCRTERVTEVQRLFSWDGPRVPFTTDVDETRPSHALADFFGPDHVHDWGWHGGPRTREWFWLGGSQCGTRPAGEVLRRYEEDPAFRAKALEAIESLKISREDFIVLLGITGPPYMLRGRVTEAEARGAIGRSLPFLQECSPWRFGPLPTWIDRYVAGSTDSR